MTVILLSAPDLKYDNIQSAYFISSFSFSIESADYKKAQYSS